MNRHFIFFWYITVSCCYSFAQDGGIAERHDITLPDTTVARLEQRWVGARQKLQDVKLESITYLSNGLRVKGYIATPRTPGKYPCVIFNRGGNSEFGALSDTRAARLLVNMASWGYVAVATQYRGNGGGEGTEEFGGKDVNDVLNLIPLLARESSADTSRIGMYGWSRGGMMTYLALTKTCRFKAAIVGSGMADLLETRTVRKEMDTVFARLIPGYNEARDSVLQIRSALYWPDKICKSTPLLIFQGSADWRVPPKQVLDFTRKLYETKHPFRFVFFEGGQHSLSEYSSEVDEMAKEFLDRYVRDGIQWPSLEPHGN